MKIDNIREYIVIVNEGSGCIFQPEDDAYSYVLTAKHNIVNNNGKVTILDRFVFENGNWRKIAIEKFSDSASDYYFPHPDKDKDTAIIKIKKVSGLDKIIRLDDLDNDRTGYSLCGYPHIRKDTLSTYRIDENITILTTGANQFREGQLPIVQQHEELVGQSGGAILKIKDNYILLAGIQNKIVAKKEELGRIEFSTLASIDEIIAAYPKHLSALHPPYYQSFAFLKEQIMKLEGCFFNIEYTKCFLRDMTDVIVANPLTPNIIRNHFRERLLVYGEDSSSFYQKGLWVAWLEFLIVMKIIGLDPKTEEDLDELFDRYRVIYTSSKDDWSTMIMDIARTDHIGLKENACLVVANDVKPQIPIISRGIIPDLALSVRKNEMQIDVGIKNPFASFKYLHVHAFQRSCIVEKSHEYGRFNNTNEEELYEKLKQEYENILNN